MRSIIINNLYVKFEDATIIKGINCEFDSGKIYGIVGNNGSGKTVLFKCTCGFICPTSGSVSVDGKIVGKDMDFPDSLGCLIENPGFFNGYSGFKNLMLLAKIKNKINKQEIIGVLEKVGLDPYEKKPVEKYSLGMKQRLGIAQAIMEDPELLILDEPLNGLDKIGLREIRKLIKDLKKPERIILITSHNPIDIEELCDVVLEVDNGVIINTKNYTN